MTRWRNSMFPKRSTRNCLPSWRAPRATLSSHPLLSEDGYRREERRGADMTTRIPENIFLVDDTMPPRDPNDDDDEEEEDEEDEDRDDEPPVIREPEPDE